MLRPRDVIVEILGRVGGGQRSCHPGLDQILAPDLGCDHGVVPAGSNNVITTQTMKKKEKKICFVLFFLGTLKKTFFL